MGEGVSSWQRQVEGDPGLSVFSFLFSESVSTFFVGDNRILPFCVFVRGGVWADLSRGEGEGVR